MKTSIFFFFLFSFTLTYHALGQGDSRDNPGKSTLILPSMSIKIDRTHPVGKAYYSQKVQAQKPGKPTSFLKKLSDGKGEIQKFENGWIICHPSFGAHYLPKDVAELWESHGGEKGSFGYPKSTKIASGGGFMQASGFEAVTLERGIIRIEEGGFNPGSRICESHGLIYQRYLQIKSKMGDIRSIELKMPDGVGRYNICENGWIYWHPEYGAHEVYNTKLGKAHQVQLSAVGYPVAPPQLTYVAENSDPFSTSGKVVKDIEEQKFSNGIITHNKISGEVVVKDKNGTLLPPYYRTYEVSIRRVEAMMPGSFTGKVEVEYVAAAGYKVSKPLFENNDPKKDIYHFDRNRPGEEVKHTFQSRSLVRKTPSTGHPMLRIKGQLGNGKPFIKEIPLYHLYERGNTRVEIRSATNYYANLIFEIKPVPDAKFTLFNIQETTDQSKAKKDFQFIPIITKDRN